MTYTATNLHKAIRSHSVFIFDQRLPESGSGVLVEVEGRFFVLTAAHVIEGDINLHFDIPLPQTRFTFLNKWVDAELDVGYLELKPFEVQMLRGELSSPFKIGARQETTVKALSPNLAICGFPRAHSTKKGNSEFVPIYFQTIALLPFEKWPDAYKESTNPQVYFLLSYGPKRGGYFKDVNGDVIETPDPRGMSGTGVWYFDQNNEESQNPSYALIGIQHHYDEFYQVLKGTYLTPIVGSLFSQFGISIPEL